MKKSSVLLMLVLSMVMVSHHVFAQEVTIPLNPGWTWFSYPRADTMNVTTAVQSISPLEGDVITSQDSYSQYTNGQWVGTLQQLLPGKGFMYKSMNANPVSLVFYTSGNGTNLPTVTTTAVTMVSNNAISGGNVTNDGGSPVTARGICYGIYPYPDLSSSFTHTENGTGTGYFTSVIDAPTSGTLYVRAYATNANGTAYGEQVIVDDYMRLPRFVYNGNTYVVAPDPQAYNEYMTEATAQSYCNNLTAYGYSDWRMPTIEELEMMYQYRTSIGGFVPGSTVLNGWTHYILYYSSSHAVHNSTSYILKLEWWSGERSESFISGYYCNDSNHEYYRCHIRPIRVEEVLPTVMTNSVYNITTTSAYGRCNATGDGGATVIEKGLCWSTTSNPTVFNSHFYRIFPST